MKYAIMIKWGENMNDYEVIEGEDILSNSLRAIKQYIPRKLDEATKHAPTRR